MNTYHKVTATALRPTSMTCYLAEAKAHRPTNDNDPCLEKEIEEPKALGKAIHSKAKLPRESLARGNLLNPIRPQSPCRNGLLHGLTKTSRAMSSAGGTTWEQDAMGIAPLADHTSARYSPKAASNAINGAGV
jgi:hypothetical protein